MKCETIFHEQSLREKPILYVEAIKKQYWSTISIPDTRSQYLMAGVISEISFAIKYRRQEMEKQSIESIQSSCGLNMNSENPSIVNISVNIL